MHVLALSCFGFLCQAVILISIQIAYGLFVALLMLLMMFSYCVINSLFPFLTSIFMFTLCLPIYLSSCIICILIITLPMKWIFKPYTYNKKMKFDKQRPTVSVQVQNTFMFHVPSHTGAAERANHPSRIRQTEICWLPVHRLAHGSEACWRWLQVTGRGDDECRRSAAASISPMEDQFSGCIFFK